MLNGYIDDEVWFGDEITPDALHALLYAEGKDHTEDVHIRLNSYGGSCNAVVRMHDDMVAYPGKVSITVSGTAASAATVLCMAANHLEMTPGSLWMIHDPSTVAIGNIRDMKDAIHLLEACKESILNVYCTRIKITRDQAANLMTKTTWMDAQTALEDGFIDAILSVRQAGPTDCIVPVADAEKRVQAWLDRHKVSASLRRDPIPMKEGVLYEAQTRPAAPQAAQVETEAEEPSATSAAQVSAPSDPPEASSEDTMQVNMEVNIEVTVEEPDVEEASADTPQHGTPISQLQKRLALIMPIEAQNKEKNV